MSVSAQRELRRPAATERQNYRGWLVAGLVFLFWAVLLLAWPGYTLHTVDNVRDYRVALDIAAGKAWPATSQPFAGHWQLPPLYFHILALPLRLWPDERAVFLFSGLFAASAIALLAFVVSRNAGRGAAAFYGAFAAPPHAVVIFPGVSNSAFAFSFVTLMLAAWFHLRARPAFAMSSLLVMGWSAVQMHPSAIAIVAPTFIASTLVAPAAWRMRSTWVVALTLAVLTLAWIAEHGVLAPEALQVTHKGVAWTAIIARLLSASHWATLWGTPWLHVRELRDLHQASVDVLAIVAASALGLGLALAFVRSTTAMHPERRFLLLASAASALGATALLSAWGFWYLDSLWPAFAVLAACGWSRLTSRFRVAGSLLAVLAAVAAISLPLLIKEAAVRTERYDIGLRGMFFPGESRTDAISIPLASALIRYRAFVAHEGECVPSRFVGLDEFWLRDLTLRFVIADCARTPVGHSSHPRYLVTTGELVDSIAVRQQFADIKLVELPATRVTINRRDFGEVQSWSPGLRYSYYEPELLPPGIDIRVDQPSHSQESQSGVLAMRPHLFVAFRCLDVRQTDIEVALESLTPLTLNRQRELSPFRYFEFRAPVDGAGDAIVTTKSALKCDVSAWFDLATTGQQ